MEMTFFKTQLTCRWCGQPGTAWSPSRAGDRGATYQVGECFGDDIALVDLQDTSLEVRAPAPGEPIHVLHWWTCEHCGKANFVDVVLANGCVSAIEPIELDPAALTRLHYINELLREVVADLIGEPLYTSAGMRPDWLPKLSAALASGRRWE